MSDTPRIEVEWQSRIIGWDDGTEAVFYQEGIAATLAVVWFLGHVNESEAVEVEAAIKALLRAVPKGNR